MAVPRPILLTLLGTVLLAATFLATRNAREQVTEQPAPPAQQQAAAPEAPEPAEKAKPRADKTQGGGNDAGKSTRTEERAAKPNARPEKRAAPAKRRARPSVAAAVKRAIKGNRTVVLFLYARGASDDRRVAASVSSLSGTKAAVFKDRIGNLGRYGEIAAKVGVTRAPSVVIIGKGRRSRLIEGYVDARTLAQRVADAR